ncbi:hypothetical protein CVU37_09315 [candidate division BRC1 bacterium HGW-BRC1-1]|jgi:glycosyltransferase involved in cell wall biosynthesis|nr:MAG: hypothetical protein CVU37_09315 [candidate division BRC1 bacterium HGW-BRC1-1]
MTKTIALVTPWFGNTNGGAEVFCGGLARALSAAGFNVEVWTTCCRDPFHDWGTNHLPEGESEANGVRVRRFPVGPRNADLYAHLYGVVANGGGLAAAQEDELLTNSINSPALVAYIRSQRDSARCFFLPYMYGTTVNGLRAADPANRFLIPCLHNEPFAYLEIMQRTFERATGCLFLSTPERDFASALYDLSHKPTALLGGGLSPDVLGDAARFRQRTGITGKFVLSVGRKVPGKGADILLNHFGDYLALNPREEVNLVMVGSGDLDVPADLRERVLSVNPQSSQDVYDAMAACEFLIHPSLYESFSLVMMEAWMNGRAVLVNGECEVTQSHVVRSNGGLYFSSLGEFCEAMHLLRTRPTMRGAMARAGRAYVEANWLWPHTVGRFARFIAEMDRKSEAAATAKS